LPTQTITASAPVAASRGVGTEEPPWASTQASALGTNIAGMLRDHAKVMRQHRLLMLEEQAGKANAKLTLPLTMCLLPAVLAAGCQDDTAAGLTGAEIVLTV
jgi:hypothetical protein